MTIGFRDRVVMAAFGLAATTPCAAQSASPPAPAAFVAKQGCVDCHRVRSDLNKDFRLSTRIAEWARQGAPKFVSEIASRTLPAGARLTGRHPDVAERVRKEPVPEMCVSCHSDPRAGAPPFAPLMHLLKYARQPSGPPGHFLTVFGGWCAHCHDLDANSGRWRTKSGREAHGG